MRDCVHLFSFYVWYDEPKCIRFTISRADFARALASYSFAFFFPYIVLLASIYFVFEIVGDFSKDRERKLEEKETEAIWMHTSKLAIWIGFNPHAT